MLSRWGYVLLALLPFISGAASAQLNPTGFPLPALSGTETVDCQPELTDPPTSPFITTCTTHQIAATLLPFPNVWPFAQTFAGIVAGGSPPTNSGSCAITNQVGGNTAGLFTTNAMCGGAGAIILTFAVAAPHGWVCFTADQTTFAAGIAQTASGPTTATFNTEVDMGDVIQFSCTGY